MCEFCGVAIRNGRPYNYCDAPDCVSQGLYYRRLNYALILSPKQGYTYVERTDTVLATGGKSSGR